MMKVYTLHKLKKGSTMEDYKKWSPEDQRVNHEHPLVKSFEVYEVIGADKNTLPEIPLGKDAPFDVIEITEVESWEDFVKLCKDDKLEEIEKTWTEKFLDEDSLVVIAVRKI
ncbi:MAG TPA: hypothetical protein ENI15_10530 [Spirochaetes bacterium]|nr:hypothetical protein [Spirochaetota bacterium]